MSNSQKVFVDNSLNNSLDDVKTTSTKSYDTHEDIQTYKTVNNNKKKQV